MWYSGIQGDICRIGYATSTITSVGVKEDVIESKLPIEFRLEQNYPNPFNPKTRIKYKIAKHTHVVLKVINSLGQEVRTLVNEKKPGGFYEVVWDGKNNFGQQVASGLYLYQLESNNFIQTRKMVLLR
jgi:flagellar hook assembly protein FlgD